MDTAPECDMLADIAAVQIEFRGIIELCWVTVGRSKEQHQVRPFGDFDASQLSVGGCHAWQPAYGRLQAQQLLGEARERSVLVGGFAQRLDDVWTGRKQ